MLFTTHVNIATLAQDKQGHTRKDRKTHCYFPHTHSLLNKKGPRKESLINRPGAVRRGGAHWVKP